jgi:uncharacterized repeat protein (TIGR02543 family)
MVAGCKLDVMVSSGGNVDSGSGTRDCAGPGYCEFDITDSSFSETFTAVPRPGFTFVKWQDGSGFLCAKSTDPVCTIEMPNETLGDAVIALFASGSIKPVFSSPQGVDTDGDGIINELDDDDDNDFFVDASDTCPLDGPDLDGFGCPSINDSETVLVNGKRWAPPKLFQDVTWNDVHAACPGPEGVCSGKLEGVDVTGWTWASAEEVVDLLNAFLIPELGPAPDRIEIDGWTDFNPNFFQYFYHPDFSATQDLLGWTRDEANVVEAYPYWIRCASVANFSLDNTQCLDLRVGAYNLAPKNMGTAHVWLYRVD